MPDIQSPNAVTDPAWWRENAQAHALTTGDISQFFANVDFNKLAARGRRRHAGPAGRSSADGADEPHPREPLRDRAGRRLQLLGQHVGFGCSNSTTTTTGCKGWYRGQLQPYAIYVPQQPMPADGYGLTLLLHSLEGNYNQFLASANQSQFGERGPGSIVITPEGRGPDGWYYDYAGADTFEVWADVAARYRLDPDWTTVAGYSMGGYGTYKFATQFPDLFAKAQPTVGPPGLGIWTPPSDPQPGGARSNTNRMLGSVRNIPFLTWYAAQDELVPVVSAQTQADSLDSLGYRYEFDLFNPAEHLTLAVNDEYGPAAELPRHDGGRPRPAARHLRLQPDHGLPGRPDRRRPRVLGLGRDAAQRVRHSAARNDRRAVSRLRCRRPGAVGNGDGRRYVDRRCHLRRSRTPARPRHGGARRPHRSRTGSTSPHRTSPR